VVWVERLVSVEFGPSRSKRFGRRWPRLAAGRASELEPGRYRTRFVLGTDAAAYTGLARLLERVLEITLGPNLRALLRGELPPNLAEGSDPDFEVPDFVPEDWGEPARSARLIAPLLEKRKGRKRAMRKERGASAEAVGNL